MPLNAKDIYSKAHEWDAVGDDPRSIDEVDPTCRACRLRYSEAGEHCSVGSGATDPEALRVALDVVADSGCISSVTVDEEAWRALGLEGARLGGGFAAMTWRGVEVCLRYPMGAVVEQWSHEVHGHLGPMRAHVKGSANKVMTMRVVESLHEKLPQPSGEGGWLLRPVKGYRGLAVGGTAAVSGLLRWRLGLGDSHAPLALVLQWGGRVYDNSFQRAETFLAMQEGREPIPVEDLRKLWPTVEAYAMRCARPREGGQEFEPFCEIIRVDNDGREVECLLPDPAECGCCGAKGETPCDIDCDALHQEWDEDRT